MDTGKVRGVKKLLEHGMAAAYDCAPAEKHVHCSLTQLLVGGKYLAGCARVPDVGNGRAYRPLPPLKTPLTLHYESGSVFIIRGPFSLRRDVPEQ